MITPMQKHLLVCCILLGCSQGPSHQGNPPATNVALITPHDLSTNWRQSITLWVDTPASQFELMDGAGIQSAFTLWSLDPNGRAATQVEARVSNRVATSSVVELIPTATIESDRWYEVQVDFSQLNSRYNGFTADETRQARRRFYTGSLPLWQVTSGWEGESTERLTVVISEALRPVADEVLEAAVTADVAGGPCVIDHEYGTDLAAGRIDLRCAGVTPDQAITVHVRPGLFSTAGVPLRGMDGSTDGTRRWTPALDGDAPSNAPTAALFSIDAASGI